MCGIAGIYNLDQKKVQKNRIENMLNTIRYRGPDDSDIHIEKGIGLGHVRLSILDLSNHAHQPMVSMNKRYVICYNGEIYNFNKLREELIKEGINLQSTGDTETLLEYISKFGIDTTLSKIEGMFAFAVWDSQKRILVIARDRHGIKPVYYKIRNNEIYFASEIKVLNEESKIDHVMINSALMGLGLTYGENTIYENIFSIPPGCVYTFTPTGKINKKSFFHMSDFVNKDFYNELNSKNDKEIIDIVEENLIESIELTLISDAPLACLASGGLDSSLIAAIANRYYNNLQLFHADVEGDSEKEKAEAIAKHLGVDLFSIKVTEEDALFNAPAVTYHNDIPLIYHTNSVPFFMVSKLASEYGIKVLLTGEGADELFVGYTNNVLIPFMRRYNIFKNIFMKLFYIKPQIGQRLWPDEQNHPKEMLKHLLFRYEIDIRKNEGLNKYDFIHDIDEKLLFLSTLDEAQGQLVTLLHRNDRLGMAWGLESRFPFLGHNLTRSALNLPGKHKIRLTHNIYDKRHPFLIDKWVIRKIAEKYLPQNFAFMKKYAFRASVFNTRITIDKNYFNNSFVSQWFKLSQKEIGAMIETSTPEWMGRLFLLDIWGRIFGLSQSVDDIKKEIKKNVRFIKK